MRPATKEQPPVAQAENVKTPTKPTNGTGKPSQAKPDWIEHRDWHGEGVVGERHTD